MSFHFLFPPLGWSKAGESEVINRVWMGIGMNQNADKVELDLSTGLLDFDREALDDIRICAWSRFNV